MNTDSDIQVNFSIKLQQQAVIRYLYLILEQKWGTEIHSELNNVYGTSTDVVYSDRQIKVDEIANTLSSSQANKGG